jgi:hypothetical protein
LTSGGTVHQLPHRDFRCSAFFKFGNRGGQKDEASGQKREDYTEEDVEYYFNYMGMLAEEGSYDSMEKLMQHGIAPVDVLLLMAASEDDAPKVSELVEAGANTDVKGPDGKTPVELAKTDDVKDLLRKPVKA